MFRVWRVDLRGSRVLVDRSPQTKRCGAEAEGRGGDAVPADRCAPTQRHGGSVRQFETVLNIQFENFVLRVGVAAVGFEHVIDRGDASSVLVTSLSTQLEQKLCA